jgi:hypothetical protein
VCWAHTKFPTTDVGSADCNGFASIYKPRVTTPDKSACLLRGVALCYTRLDEMQIQMLAIRCRDVCLLTVHSTKALLRRTLLDFTHQKLVDACRQGNEGPVRFKCGVRYLCAPRECEPIRAVSEARGNATLISIDPVRISSKNFWHAGGEVQSQGYDILNYLNSNCSNWRVHA